jgi:hypothetical protein
VLFFASRLILFVRKHLHPLQTKRATALIVCVDLGGKILPVSNKKQMESEPDDNDHRVYELSDIFSTTRRLNKLIELLETFFTQSVVKFSRDICSTPRISSEKSSFFCINTKDGCVCGFVNADFSWVPSSSPKLSGCKNKVIVAHKLDFGNYLSYFTRYVENIPDEYVIRYAADPQNISSLHLETFIAAVACHKQIGPNIYGTSSNVQSDKPVAWMLEKGTCDLSVSIMNLSSKEEAVAIAEATQSLMLRIAKNRLVLFDIKLQNLLDMGRDKSVENRVLAIDFDPKFTLFAPKSFVAFTFVVNTTLLLASVRCWYGNQNPFVSDFITHHCSMIEHYLHEWEDELLIDDLYELLYKKFFRSEEEYIGDFFRDGNRNIPKVTEIHEIATRFKGVFSQMAHEYILSYTENEHVPMYNKAHFCQVLEWLGVTRTSGCNNEKLLQLATKNLPENWAAVSIHSSPCMFKIMYQNLKLQVQTADRPPEFQTLHEQLNWYIKLMLQKHRSVNADEKELTAMRFYDILLSEENKWYLMDRENEKVKNIFIRKLFDFKQQNKDPVVQSWCDDKLNHLLPS